MPESEPTVRVAEAGDADILAAHRVGMFRDMGQLGRVDHAELHELCRRYFVEAIPRGEYVGWLATAGDGAVVGGGGVQLRRILPRPDGDAITLGPEAIVLNVYTDPAWRRRGVAELLMQSMLGWLDERGITRVVLHASADGRRIYERLGFQSTNEMRLSRAGNPHDH